ncbi:isoflavone reductase, partial [Tanacetum coccineum]
ENIVTQNQLVEKWEKVSGKTLEKVHISKEDFLASMKLDMDEAIRAALARIYHIFYEGCMMNFEIEDGEEASKLYPEVRYTRMDEYLARYL